MIYRFHTIRINTGCFRNTLFRAAFSVLFWFILTLLTPVASAQSGEDFGGLLIPQRPGVAMDMRMQYYPTRPVRHQATGWRQYQYETRLQAPLAGGRNQLWSAGVFLQQLYLTTDATLPRTPQTPLPSTLTNIGLNVRHRRLFDNGHSLGLSGNLGSATDQPFHSQREIDVNLLALWQIPAEQKRSWLLFLSYANRRVLPGLDHIPLPGIAHLWRTDKTDWFMLGIPASAMQMEILPAVQLNLIYLPIRNLNAAITWKAHDQVSLYTRFNSGNDRFWRAARENTDHSLNFNHNKASIGGRWSVLKQLSIEVETGLAFNRFVYEAEKYSNRSDNRLDIANGWFAGLRADWRF